MTRIDNEPLAAYRTARAAFLAGDTHAADAYYRALRTTHAIDLYYEVDLPPHLLLIHPLATVLGRATYGDYLVAYNNVSVGSTVDREYPTLGEGVVLFPGARVLGNTRVGNNVWITANTVVQGVDVPDNSVVFAAPVPRSGRVYDVTDHATASISRTDHMDQRWHGTYTSIGCAWRPTTRNVRRQFFPSDE